MPTKLGPLSEFTRGGNIYEARDQPPAGVGIVDAPQLEGWGDDAETLHEVMGAAGTHPFVGSHPSYMSPPQLGGKPRVTMEPPDVAEPAPSGPIKLGPLADFQRSASTIAPKGGTPYQPLVAQDTLLETIRGALHSQEDYSKRVQAELDEKRTLGGNALIGAQRGIGNAVLKTGPMLADLVSMPQRMPGIVMGGQPAFPMMDATPGVNDLAAQYRALQGGMTADQARENMRLNEAARHEAYPWGGTASDVAEFVAPIALGRPTTTTALRGTIEQGLGRKIAQGKTVYESMPIPIGKGDEILKQAPGFNEFLRGMGRVGEAFVEGGYGSLLQNNDPLIGAGAAAGAQGVMSGTSAALLRKFAKHPSRVTTFALNAAILSGLFYTIDVLLPGKAFDYEANKTAIRKMLIGYGVGGVLAPFASRPGQGLSFAKAPHLTDVLGNMPRNAGQSILLDYVGGDKDRRADLGGKLKGLLQNLPDMSAKQIDALNAAFRSGNRERFYKEIDKLQVAQ